MIAKNWDELKSWAKIGKIREKVSDPLEPIYDLFYVEGQLYAQMEDLQAQNISDIPDDGFSDWVLSAHWEFVNPPNATWFLEEDG